MNEIVLGGCSPTPLASYLKALGVLRLLSGKYPETKAAWRNESLWLRTPLTCEQMEQFFLHEYQPTPVMAPWNGGSGFYEKDNKYALNIILKSDDARLDTYRNCLGMVEEALTGMDRSASPKGEEKVFLLVQMRGLLPDEALDWLDAAVFLTGDTPQYPPLLGTGGNDGRLDFTNNFMQRLVDVLCLDGKSAEAESRNWLRMSLFGEPAAGLINSKIGQFSPGQAGGPNATTGFKAEAVINPWDFVLMIEGALLFAAAAVRRHEDDPYGALSYPFTVTAVGAGFGGLGEGDKANARGELWMPLWSQYASYPEVRALLSEGRVVLGRKPARNALDFIRAIHHLGGYRGIRSFQRYAFLKRNGDAHLATPLTRVEVTDKPRTNLLDELDQNHWLEEFRKFAQSDEIAKRFHTLCHDLEDIFFKFSGKESTPAETQAILTLLGEIQSALASSSKARENVNPIPLLSKRWIQQANDHTPAFRIACALAGLRGTQEIRLPIMAQIFPVHPCSPRWKEDTEGDRKRGKDLYDGVRLCMGMAGSLPNQLRHLLERRLWLAEKLEMNDKPLQSASGATLEDVAAFLEDDSMDRKIAALLPGLSLCKVPEDDDRRSNGTVPAAFALLKLCFTPNSILRSLGVLQPDVHLPVPPGVLTQLASEHKPDRMVLAAWRRLRIAGMEPVFTQDALPALDGISAQRVAAALLIPLRYGAYGKLAGSVLKKIHDAAGNPAA
jgi:CRISPR-associated protein Csx17